MKPEKTLQSTERGDIQTQEVSIYRIIFVPAGISASGTLSKPLVADLSYCGCVEIEAIAVPSAVST